MQSSREDGMSTTMTKTAKNTEKLDYPGKEEEQPVMNMIRARIFVAEKGALMVMTDLGPLSCHMAASCLLRPECGDLALVATPGDHQGQAYVLAVLERAEPHAAMHVDLGHGARLEAENGDVEIRAGADLRLNAGADLDASASGMTFTASSVRWLSHVFSVLGSTVETICSLWRETSTDRETSAQTWTQRLGDCHRHVQDLDETQAGVSRTLARDTALLHGRVSYVQAEEFVKVDGQEVHLG
jgi:hypothetical protein